MSMDAPAPVLTPAADVQAIAERVLGSPAHLVVLKHKPGRRCTWRAIGPGGSAIVKTYASQRAATVAARLVALAGGADEPVLPGVLLVDDPQRVVVLTEVTGIPLSAAVSSGDLARCRAAGAAIARWHMSWSGHVPPPLRPHTAEAELATLDRWLGRLPSSERRSVGATARQLAQPWPCSTVVHRDLYEQQVILGDRVGLIDLDDAAAGPPELDVGNLAAHLELLALRRGAARVRPGAAAVLAGYRGVAAIDEARFDRCRRLTMLRLACIHGDRRLVDLVHRARPGIRSRPTAAESRSQNG